MASSRFCSQPVIDAGSESYRRRQIVIDLYVVIEYGTRIATVAQNIQSVVKYTVEKALGVPVVAVNVHVQDLRVSCGLTIAAGPSSCAHPGLTAGDQSGGRSIDRRSRHNG